MSIPPLYLDHAATTPMDAMVQEAMRPFWEETFGNPSSLHRFGKEARKAMEAARSSIAKVLGAASEEICFTSGGTESNNLAILGLAHTLGQTGKRHLIVSAIEHPSILTPCRFLEQQGWRVTYLPVDSEGFISPEALRKAIEPDTAFASLMHGNNEIGTLQPLETLGELLRDAHIPFHTDAVQTVGKLPLDLKTLPVDYLSLSGHKLYGPKGIGALFIRHTASKPSPLVWGGGQEQNRRSGTEDVAGIVGLSVALERCLLQQGQELPRIYALQEQLIQGIEAQVPEGVLNGPRDVKKRVPGNVNVSFPPMTGEALVLQLDMKGIAVSSGSACHSAVIEPSHVVLALGKSRDLAQSTIRFSLGRSTTPADIEKVLEVLPRILKRLSASSVSSAS